MKLVVTQSKTVTVRATDSVHDTVLTYMLH